MKKKRTPGFVFIVLLVLGTLSGIRGEKLLASSARHITLTFSAGHDPSGIHEALIRRFEETHPDIKIRVLELPNSTDGQHERYVTALAAEDSSLDVIAADIIWPPEFASAGWLLPLDPFLPPSEQKKFIDGATQGVRYKGKLYAVPWFCNAGLLFYRKDLLEKEGLSPPRTWDDLLKAAGLLQRKYKIDGLVFQAARYEGLVCDFLEYLWGNGGDVFDKDGNITIDRPEAIEALQFLTDLIHKHRLTARAVTSYQEQESFIAFTQGHAAFLRSWPYVYMLSFGKDSRVAGKVGMVPMVYNKGKSAGTLGAWNLAISRFSKHPKESWEFIRFLSSHESQVLATLKGRTPSLKSVYGDPRIKKEAPYLSVFYRTLAAGKPRPVTPLYPKISIILQIQVHRAITREISPEAALKEAARKIRNLYNKYKLPVGT
ncbi:MAG: ABC transporter substrate-binding protein [Armatimonadetes bacterium]|nr:ABC transporter substrate-binding protein [Armatimonadota bacterium]